MHRVPTFLHGRKSSRQMPQLPWSARHNARRVHSVQLLETRHRSQRSLDVEVPHVSTGKGWNNSCDSRRRRHTPQTSKIIPTTAQHLGKGRNSESDWDLQRPRCLTSRHTYLATKSQKTRTSLGRKRRLLLRPLLADGRDRLSHLPSERCQPRKG